MRSRHDKRKFFSDARATPPPIIGLMINSSIATFERSTRYSSTSRVDLGGLKFHCCRTISLSELSPFEDHGKTNCWVRSVSFSSKNKGYALESLGLIEDQTNHLTPRRRRAPASRIFRDEGCLNRKVFIFRRDFHYGRTLYV
jgi:hypothetical protein